MDGGDLVRPAVVATSMDLARRKPFRLGATVIDPASREVLGPGGSATIEPRVMQVLVVLADEAGGVVTRTRLDQLCWNGVAVGDDSLNRAIAEVRRVARTLASGGFAVETIPRTGYRLVGAAPQPLEPPRPEPPGASPSTRVASRTSLPRRPWLLAGAGAALAMGGLWAVWPDPKIQRAKNLADRAEAALNGDLQEDYAGAIALLREATGQRPDDPRLWGRLALALKAAAEVTPPGRMNETVAACEIAAARALALDAWQADARTALATLRPTYGDWFTTEKALRAILTDRPGAVAASAAMGVLMQAVGRSREAAAINLKLAAGQPLSAAVQYRTVYSLWNLDRLGEADRAADRAIASWPHHPGVWFARLWLMGFTGRTRVALAQIDDVDARPRGLTDQLADLLRLSMRAIAAPNPHLTAQAVRANLAAAAAGPGGAINGVMLLTALGRLDEAFAVAEGYLARSGPLTGPLRDADVGSSVPDQRHRKTMMLFVPVTKNLRGDPRFLPLCEACGLADYWRRSGRRPDFLSSDRI